MNAEVFEQLESEVRSYCRIFPAVFTKAKNSYIWDEDGRQYIDFFSGAGALNYGHNNDRVLSMLIEYIKKDGIVHSLDMYTSAKRDFISTFDEKILAPRHLQYKFMFPGPTGTNAVEAALKTARLATKRQTIAAFTNAYHGVTLGALATTGASNNRSAAGVSLQNVVHLPFENYFGTDVDTIKLAEKLFLDPCSGWQKPAAFLLETVQGEGGLNTASSKWLLRLCELAKKIGSLIIVDDIQAGCGRCGDYFSFDESGIKPDIVCLSKSLSGIGLPLSLILIKPDLDIWHPDGHNGTFRGNNFAFIAGHAAIKEYWSDSDFKTSITSLSQLIEAKLQQILTDHKDKIIEIRGRGMMRGLVFAEPAMASEVSRVAFAQYSLIVEVCGPRNEVLKILPPLTINRDTLTTGLHRLYRAI